MTEREANQAGFHYTGMSCSEWDKEDWEKYKKEAQEIKKTYQGADFRVVYSRERTRYGSITYRNIYGNDIFYKAMHFSQETEEQYLNQWHQETLERLKKEYEAKVQEEMDHFNKRKQNYDFLMSIKK